jgi:hypothetical protein
MEIRTTCQFKTNARHRIQLPLKKLKIAKHGAPEQAIASYARQILGTVQQWASRSMVNALLIVVQPHQI